MLEKLLHQLPSMVTVKHSLWSNVCVVALRCIPSED